EHQPAGGTLWRLRDDAGDAVQGPRRLAGPRPGLEPRTRQAARARLPRRARGVVGRLTARNEEVAPPGSRVTAGPSARSAPVANPASLFCGRPPSVPEEDAPTSLR